MPKYALLIGIDDYPATPPRPACTQPDAIEALAAVLRSRSIGGFGQVWTLCNPDRERLQRALRELAKLGRQGDLLLLYIAAAGVLDTDGRARLLLPGGHENLHEPHNALALAAVLSAVQLSACKRRVVLLDAGFSAARATGSSVLARERMRLDDTAIIAGAAGEPFVPVDGTLPRRRLLGPWLTGRLADPPTGQGRGVTVADVYDWLSRDRPAGEVCDVPRLWLGHHQLGALELVRPRGSTSGRRGSRKRRAARTLEAIARPAEAAGRSHRWRGTRRHAARTGHRHRHLRLGGLLRAPLRLAGLALLGPMALFMAADDAPRDLQLAARKLLHQTAPTLSLRLFVDDRIVMFSDALQSGGHGPALAALPGGWFRMGSPRGELERHGGEGPTRRIAAAPFALTIAEVSFSDYDRFAEATGRKPPADAGWGRGNRPAINVSWDDAAAYADWLSIETGARYTLPTEAQWEYAARAGTATPFATGGCIHTDQANYNGIFDYAGCGARTGIFRGRTLPATELPPNPWGLYHMHGNAWEWVQDCWRPNYGPVPSVGQQAADRPPDPAGGCRRRIMRGGGWRFEPGYLRSALRLWSKPDTRNGDIGFRVARALD